MVRNLKVGLLFIPLAILLSIFLLTPNAAPIVYAQPTGWVELVGERTITSKSYANLSNPGQRSWHGSISPIHYESTPGSGVFDTEIDFNPRRVNNSQLDGWLVTQNGWHYALGKPGDTVTDGWVGFGGRQGENWIKFRLARVGYLYGPTRTWEDLGGPPTYDRGQLSSQTYTSEVGRGNLITSQAITTWSNLWNTPGGGSLNITWRMDGSNLKEEIIINQAAREWLSDNRPPSTPASQTWFGFVMQVDWSDVPKALRDGIELDLSSDFTDNGNSIELRDSINRFLAFMPVSDVRVPTGDPLNPFDIRTIQKRFWLDVDGNHYVLLGIRLPELVSMIPGDLIFDPTINEQVGASGDDGYSHSGGGYSSVDSSLFIGLSGGDSYDSWLRFTTVAIDQGATINSANITVEARTSGNDGVNVLTNIYAEDADNPAAPTTQGDHVGRSRTTAFTAWDGVDFTINIETVSPDISSVIQEITDRGGWATGNSLQILWDEDGSVNGFFYDMKSFDLGAAVAVELDVDWTAAAGWTNTAPTITNKITNDTIQVDLAYARSFSATDPDTNQTLAWELNITDAPFTISVWNGGNRTTWVNATPDTVGTYFVNVTVGDDATTGNTTDFVNYTFTVTEVPPGDINVFIVGIIGLALLIILGLLFTPILLVAAGVGGLFLGFVVFDVTRNVGITAMFFIIAIVLMLIGALNIKAVFQE